MIAQELYIGGAWETGAGTRSQVRDKWNDELVGTFETAGEDQVARAIDAAQAALDTGLPAHRRAEILRRAALSVQERTDELADLLRREAGKPITAARGEVARCVQTLLLSSAAASRTGGESLEMSVVPTGEGITAFTRPVPVGVVAAITPFNFPLNLVAHKLGPALAAGCPVVLKPSERTPLSSGALVQILVEAGLPAGWLNLVTGEPAAIVAGLAADDRVKVVTFTGSSAVGWQLKANSPCKRHVLELGSNTGAIVAADANLDRVVECAVTAAFAFSGQACVALQRLYVDRQIIEPLTQRLSAAADALIAGDPAREDVTVGPLISDDALARVEDWVAEAVAGGARLVAGGKREGRALCATVLTDVKATDRVVCEEIFGPVLSILPVDGIDDGIAALNASRFGLNAAVFTRDLATAMKCTRELEAGSVLVNLPPAYRSDNMPYGGVKDSGQGREGVAYAVAELTEQRLVLMHEG